MGGKKIMKNISTKLFFIFEGGRFGTKTSQESKNSEKLKNKNKSFQKFFTAHTQNRIPKPKTVIFFDYRDHLFIRNPPNKPR